MRLLVNYIAGALIGTALFFTYFSTVKGTTIRSHYNDSNSRRRLLKGENERQLSNYESTTHEKKHAGNLLLALDQVWTGTSSIKAASTIKTACKKPKKEKKKGEGISGDSSVGIGKGSGKGNGKGSGKGFFNSDGNSGSVTSNSTTTNNESGSAGGNTTASSSSNSTSVTSTTAVATNNSNTTRWLESNTTTSNIFNNINTTVTATNTSSDTSTNTFNGTIVITVTNSSASTNSASRGGKGGRSKKAPPPKVAVDDLPYCEDDDNEDGVVGAPSSPRAPSATVSSPVVPGSSPIASPSASVTTPSSPLQLPVGSPASTPTNTSAVAVASTCEAYELGAAPTSAPSLNHTTFITLNIDAGADVNSIYSEMETILNEKVGPLILDCIPERRVLITVRPHRSLQANDTELVNILFTIPTFTGESCAPSAENTTCVPSSFESELYFLGEEPVGIDEKLRQALLFTDFNIPGLQSIVDVVVTNAASEDGSDPDTEPAPSPTTDRGAPTNETVIETTQESKNGTSAGVAVAIAVSLLALVLAAVFLVRRHRDENSIASLSKHIEFTDDFPDDAGAETADDNSAISHQHEGAQIQKSFVVGDQSFDESWNSEARRISIEGQEVYAASLSGSMRQYPQTTFVETDGIDSRLTNPPKRFYEAADTVNL